MQGRISLITVILNDTTGIEMTESLRNVTKVENIEKFIKDYFEKLDDPFVYHRKSQRIEVPKSEITGIKVMIEFLL